MSAATPLKFSEIRPTNIGGRHAKALHVDAVSTEVNSTAIIVLSSPVYNE